MAILCLAKDMDDLKVRLDRIAIAYDTDGNLITAGKLGATGALATCLKDAMCPNLVQSLEGVPALVHGGPFANISHGCNTCIATKTALKLGDIVVTEAGFGADLGAEKFLDIKCRDLGIWPDLVVIVTTVRSLKYNAGIPKDRLSEPNPEAVKIGLANVIKHIENMQNFGVPVLVASNRFLTDTEEELAIVEEACKATGADFAPAEIFAKGGEGGIDLANKAVAILGQNNPKNPKFTYELTDSVEEKIVTKVEPVDTTTVEKVITDDEKLLEEYKKEAEELKRQHPSIDKDKPQYLLSSLDKDGLTDDLTLLQSMLDELDKYYTPDGEHHFEGRKNGEYHASKENQQKMQELKNTLAA